MNNTDQNSEDNITKDAESNRISSLWSLISTWAPIVLAALAFSLSMWTFYDNREFQRKASSVDAMKEHLKLSIDHIDDTVSPWQKEDIASSRAAIPETGYKDLTAPEKRYVWYASHALFTAETIYNWQVGDDTRWNEVEEEKKKNPWLLAARQFVQDHWTYIRWDYSYNGGNDSSVCNQFSMGFISFMKEESGVTNLCPNVS